MSLSTFAQDNIYLYNGIRYNVKVIKEKYSTVLVRKDTLTYEIDLNTISRIDLGTNLPELMEDTIKPATTKEWEPESDLKSYTKNELIERAGVNLNAAGGCMLSGLVIAAISPFLATTKDVSSTDYSAMYIGLGIAGGLELAAMFCFMSAGSNLQQAAIASDKKLTYRISPVSGGICFRF
ncbi:MAG: hypothetical protein EBZ58_04615 [Bacteroidetes bacterium]|nr:hypothetical protein [Bacteroidota bacterium]